MRQFTGRVHERLATTDAVPAAREEAAPDALPFKRLDGRLKLLLALGFAALLLVGVFLLVGKVAGYTKALDSLKEAKPVWLAVCFVSQIVSYAGYVALFRDLAAPEGRPPPRLWLSLKVVFASLGATRLLAAGGAGGLAVLYWAFHHTGRTRREAAVRMLAFNVLLYAFFGAATLAACALVLVGADEAPLAMTLPWIVCLAGLFAAAAWVTSPERAERLARPAEGRLRSAFSAAVAAAVLSRGLALRPAEHRGAVFGPAVYWFGDMVCLWAALRAFDVHLSPWLLVVVYATGFLANFIPLPTGGVGGVDAATTFAITAVGVPLSQAMVAVFAYRFFSFLLPTLPAVLAIPALRGAGSELEAYAAEGRGGALRGA